MVETKTTLFSSLGSLYIHSGGSGDLIGGPSGSAENLGGGELFGVEVVGDVTTTLGAGVWLGEAGNE